MKQWTKETPKSLWNPQIPWHWLLGRRLEVTWKSAGPLSQQRVGSAKVVKGCFAFGVPHIARFLSGSFFLRLLAFGLCRSNLWECCPRGLHGGSLGFRIVFCCFLAHRLLYGIFVICCSLLFYFAIPILGVLQYYHLFCYVSDDYELTSWLPTVLFLGCVLLVLFLFLLVFFLLCTVTAQWIMYRSYSVLLLMHIVVMMMLPLH